MMRRGWIGILSVAAAATLPSAAPAGDYLEPDSAWKVLENLQTAYSLLDIDGYISCLGDGFEFVYVEVDTTGERVETRWGADVEEEFHRAMFAEVERIDFALTGDGSEPRPEAGEGSVAMERGFELEIATEGDHYETVGELLFVCRPDSAGRWAIVQWWDVTGSRG